VGQRGGEMKEPVLYSKGFVKTITIGNPQQFMLDKLNQLVADVESLGDQELLNLAIQKRDDILSRCGMVEGHHD
jgi:hypothetical protein